MRLLLYPTVATTTGNSVSYTFSVEGSVGLMTGLGVTCYMTCWSLLESTVTSVDLCRSLPLVIYYLTVAACIITLPDSTGML